MAALQAERARLKPKRRPAHLVGFAIYLAAIANSVYSCWALTGAAFWVTMLTAVIGESALTVALPRALRGNLVAIVLASSAVVGINELRALTTSDLAHERAALDALEVASKCPPITTSTTTQGGGARQDHDDGGG